MINALFLLTFKPVNSFKKTIKNYSGYFNSIPFTLTILRSLLCFSNLLKTSFKQAVFPIPGTPDIYKAYEFPLFSIPFLRNFSITSFSCSLQGKIPGVSFSFNYRIAFS